MAAITLSPPSPVSSPVRARADAALGLEAPSPEELLVAAGAGDSSAFSRLFDEFAPLVLAVTKRVLRNRAMAEEVSQEVFAEVWQKAARFDPDRGSASGWVGTLARRRAIDRVRSEQAARDRVERRAAMAASLPFDEVAEAVEISADHARVRSALDTLTDVQREAIHLAYFEGHTYREVAEVLAIPEGTAKSRLRDGLRRLRDELDD
ncbi:MAG: ECF RNA polymerase sigma factor SigK [Nitriliruptorales bacterium]|nr:ECF RNA polymerase sigma factor SigK [Nitriliruptorales bacterium]